MATVEITGLRKNYGDVAALRDITLSIAAGSFYTLLGPSGCGKTTLLRTIAGFHDQNARPQQSSCQGRVHAWFNCHGGRDHGRLDRRAFQ